MTIPIFSEEWVSNTKIIRLLGETFLGIKFLVSESCRTIMLDWNLFAHSGSIHPPLKRVAFQPETGPQTSTKECADSKKD